MEITFNPAGIDNKPGLRIFKNEPRENADIYISVIIPCHNVSDYIDRCMQTVVNQTIGIERLQIILINDASTDNTLSKLLEWRNFFPDEITVVTYENNLRQGGARNIGIHLAKASYIGFVDSDDWIELDMYETLYKYAKNKKYDYVSGKFIREHFPGEKSFNEENCEKNRADQSYEFECREGFYVNNIKESGNNGALGGIWSAVYKKDVIINNNVFFPENIAYEDNYWGSVLGLYMKNLYIADKIIYHYFISPRSTVTEKNALHHLDRLNIEILKVEEYKRRGAFPLLYKELELEFIKLFYLNTLYIIFMKFNYIPEGVFEFMKDRLLFYFPDYKENPGLKECTARERLLLSLLDIPGGLSVKDMEKIKSAYLKTF